MNASWGCWRSTSVVRPSVLSPAWKSSGYPEGPISGSSESIPCSSTWPAPSARHHEHAVAEGLVAAARPALVVDDAVGEPVRHDVPGTELRHHAFHLHV